MQECSQVSACITSANNPLAKPSHIPKYNEKVLIYSSSLVGITLKSMARGQGHSERQIIGILNVFNLQVPTVLRAQS